MKRKLEVSLFCMLLFIGGAISLQGQETGHYSPGLAGIKAATLPPPGFYYIMHNVYYSANSFNDGNGNDANLDFDLGVLVNGHRFVYVWEDVLFGADYAVNVIIPLVNTNISIGAFNVDDNKFGIGDVIIDPLALTWHKEKYDFVSGLTVVAPTGSYDITKAASPGKSFWTGMLLLGGTYYLDAHKSMHVSLLGRYETHSKKKDFDVTAGDALSVEWGIGKTFPKKQIWNLGVSGYGHWQTTEDSGADVFYDPTVKDRVFAVGPEVDCFIPQVKLSLELRGQFEFGAIDRPQGSKVTFSIVKVL